MGNCVIIAPLYKGEEAEWLKTSPGDMLICADGGYAAAVRYGLKPDLVVGDFDSMPEEKLAGYRGEVLKLPVYKDDTDMVVCLNEGRKRGYTHFRIAGCMGGRFDHTLANMASLCDCAERGEEAWMCDGQNRVRVLTPGSYELTDAAAFDHVSLLAFSPEVTGITLTGTEWELKDAVLTQRYPLGCSNIARSAAPRLRFETGLLTLVYSKGG